MRELKLSLHLSIVVVMVRKLFGVWLWLWLWRTTVASAFLRRSLGQWAWHFDNLAPRQISQGNASYTLLTGPYQCDSEVRAYSSH